MKVIYYVQEGLDGDVKIGITAIGSVNARIGQLQCGNPRRLYLRVLLAGDESIERRLHSQYRGWHRRGEWFTADVLEHLPDDLQRLDVDTSEIAAQEAGENLRELAAQANAPKDPVAYMHAVRSHHPPGYDPKHVETRAETVKELWKLATGGGRT